MKRREFFTAAAAGVTAEATAETQAEAARQKLADLESTVTASPDGGFALNTAVSELCRSIKDADVVVIN